VCRQYYRIAKDKHPKGHVFRGGGERPLQDRFPDVEDILERRRPTDKDDRGKSVYLRGDRDFDRVGVTYGEGYIHAVDPVGDVERRDLVWTGILQRRYIQDERFRKKLRPHLTDDQIADKWWAGEGSETPDWEYVAPEATVVDVEDDPTKVKPNSPLLKIFDET
jgi:hypothetical protein